MAMTMNGEVQLAAPREAVWAKLNDPEVLKANPWYGLALPVVESAKSRPVTERYAEVSDVVRTQTSAALARVSKPEATVDEIESRLQRVLR